MSSDRIDTPEILEAETVGIADGTETVSNEENSDSVDNVESNTGESLCNSDSEIEMASKSDFSVEKLKGSENYHEWL